MARLFKSAIKWRFARWRDRGEVTKRHKKQELWIQDLYDTHMLSLLCRMADLISFIITAKGF